MVHPQYLLTATFVNLSTGETGHFARECPNAKDDGGQRGNRGGREAVRDAVREEDASNSN